MDRCCSTCHYYDGSEDFKKQIICMACEYEATFGNARPRWKERDKLSELNEDKRTKGIYMTTEELLQDILEAKKLNSDVKSRIDTVLNYAYSAIRDSDKKSNEEYKKGTKDAWELARQIICDINQDGMSSNELQDIFGSWYSGNIMKKYTYDESKKLLDDYEEYHGQNKDNKTDYDEFDRGDVVICKDITGKDSHEGIFCGISADRCYYIMFKHCNNIKKMPMENWHLTKTGKHIDLEW